MTYDCIIIGGGAAGLMCGAAFTRSLSGLILEGTSRIGTKLLASGSGQCNITHAGSIKDFIEHYNNSGRKFRSSLFKYNNQHLVTVLEDGGIATTVMDNGKIFPESMRARDIHELFVSRCTRNGFVIHTDSKVRSIDRHGDLWAVETHSGNSFCTRSLVIATGGCSYPKTGSDGSMFKVLADDLSLTISELGPALVPIKVENYPFTEISGVSIENAQVSISSKVGKYKHCEPLLFTHHDFSGPAILNSSRYAVPGGSLTLNYVPPCTDEEATRRIQKAMQGSKADIASVISKEFDVPKRFVRLQVDRATDPVTGSISTRKLASLLTADNFLISGTSGYSQAMVTRGGVDISEISPKTMEVRKCPGIYVIGECLDVDGHTGGYNLQFAYSTACAAAASIENNL